MVGAELLLENRQGALVEGFGLPIAPHRVIEPRQSVEAGGGGGMVGAELLLANRQGALVEWFGLPIAPH